MNAVVLKRLRCGLISATALAGGIIAVTPTQGWTATPTAQAAQTADYHIPAQGLTTALRQFAEVSGLQLAYNAKITAEKTSAGVDGRMSASAALSQLLAGSGLNFQISSGAVVITPAAANGAVALGTLKIDGYDARPGASPINGVNGSRDIEATEGSGSYTTGATSIVSKAPQSLRETPQSVSVMTAQQIQDQNLFTLRDVMDQMPGISVNQDDANSLSFEIFSRGFQITNFQIDGGAPLSTANTFRLVNTAEFDSVQLTRGADGLFGGYSDPSGVINLVRKKPLDHAQFTYEQDIGSWNNFREQVDVTGPLAFAGKLRGRLVVSRQDNDFFYHIANSHNTLFYGVLEYDLTPNTLLTVGGSYSRLVATPSSLGLPRYDNGDSLNLPVSTCLCFPFNRTYVDGKEGFIQIDHKFNKYWATKLNFTYKQQTADTNVFGSNGAVGLGTTTGPTLLGGGSHLPDKQFLLDYNLTGGFDVFGLHQSLVIGANYSYDDAAGLKTYGDPYRGSDPSINVFNFNPNAPQYVEPPYGNPLFNYSKNEFSNYGVYANVRLELLKGLHVTTGMRFSGYDSSSISLNDYTSIFGSFCKFITCVSTVHSTPGRDTSHSTPTVGVTYDLPKNFTLYGSYASVYQPQQPISQPGGPLFAPPPITGYTEELGLKWESPSKRLNASISAFSTKQDGLAETNPDGTLNYDLSSYTSQGIDTEVAGEILPGWQVSASYTYSSNKSSFVDVYAATPTTDTNPITSFAPKNLVKTWTTYRLPSQGWLGRMTVGGGLNFQSKAYNAGRVCVSYISTIVNGQPLERCDPSVARVPFQFTTKMYALLNLRLAYKVTDHTELSLNLNNVTNVKTYQTNNLLSPSEGNWYIPPINFLLALRAKW